MRCHLPALGICVALALAAAAAAAQNEGEAATTVSLDIKDTGLGDVLMLLHWQTGASFAAELPPADAPRVTLTVDDVSLEEALDLVVKPVGYRWERVGSLYAVGPPPRPIEMASVAQEEAYLLFPFRARLDVARLMAGLSPTQWDALAAHGSLTWNDLTPDQHDALTALYEALGAYWVKSAQVDPESLPTALRGARLEPADRLSFGLRTWTWALQ